MRALNALSRSASTSVTTRGTVTPRKSDATAGRRSMLLAVTSVSEGAPLSHANDTVTGTPANTPVALPVPDGCFVALAVIAPLNSEMKITVGGSAMGQRGRVRAVRGRATLAGAHGDRQGSIMAGPVCHTLV